MAKVSGWFGPAGFEVWHAPGISRALRYEFADGSYLLVNDLGGFDVPEDGEPFDAVLLSGIDDALAGLATFSNTGDFSAWFEQLRIEHGESSTS